MEQSRWRMLGRDELGMAGRPTQRRSVAGRGRGSACHLPACHHLPATTCRLPPPPSIALKNVNLPLCEKSPLIGPSRVAARAPCCVLSIACDLYPGNHFEGAIVLIQTEPICWTRASIPSRGQDAPCRWCSRNPIHSPKSIYENVTAYGLRVHEDQKRSILDDKVEEALTSTALCMRSTPPQDMAFALSAVNSSACASHGLWRRPPRFCFSTNRPQRSIPIATGSIEN